MKKLISTILAVCFILTAFTGCTGGEVKQTNEELTIWYEGDYNNQRFREAIKKYEAIYPDVKLNIENLDFDFTSDWSAEFAKKLSTAIMAGEGPDVIQLGIMASRMGELVSVAKMINSGVFADLSGFYDNDTELDKNDLYEAVMDAGVFDGERYFIPTQFRVPILVSNKKQIQESGIDLSRCDTYNNFIDETTPILEKWINGETNVKLFSRNKALSLNYYHNGLKYIDFKNQEIKFNDDEFKKWMEYYKLVYNQVPSLRNGDMESQFWAPGSDDIICKDYVFEDLSPWPFGQYFNAAIQTQTDPIIHPLYNDDGSLPIKLHEMYAINAKSQNKQNAWDFIKITITPEFFANSTISFMDIPISKKATVEREKVLEPVTPEVYNTYIKALEKLSAEEPFFDSAQYDVLTYMEPFFKGEKDYDTCLTELKDRLELYVSE